MQQPHQVMILGTPQPHPLTLGMPQTLGLLWSPPGNLEMLLCLKMKMTLELW